MSKKINWDRAKSKIPYLDDADWKQKLLENPDVLYRIIADSYDLILREREREDGVVRIGRRPKPSLVPIDEVIDSVFPSRYSNEPFVVALRHAMNGQSQRAFSQLVPCNQATMSRLLNGQLKPDITMLEQLAAAAEVPPWYFREWRAEYVGALVRDVLMEDPSMSYRAIKALEARAKK